MARVNRAAILVAALVLGACHFAPMRHGLRYVPNGAAPGGAVPDYALQGQVARATLGGADVTVDLASDSVRLQVTVRNATAAPIDVRMGGDGAVPGSVAGEVLQRPLDLAAVAERPDVAPVALWQYVRVPAGWSAAFYLDSLLGREPDYGQLCTFVIEARSATGAIERRVLPLIARYAESTPDPRAR